MALFTQAQQIVDQLIDEAVERAQDLMTAARRQQKEILDQAREAAARAPRGSDPIEVGAAALGAATGVAYDRPITEVEYVRTFAQVAQVQLRSVLDALTEQVDRLGTVPDLAGTRAQPSAAWADPAPPHIAPVLEELPAVSDQRPWRLEAAVSTPADHEH
ncbi:hypothetical protein ACQBAU_12735 [Propionibacteriaceae bacterium Y2011]